MSLRAVSSGLAGFASLREVSRTQDLSKEKWCDT
jgi:hypothetical protein